MTRLTAGETVSFRPRGNSMAPKIQSGQLCTVTPVDPAGVINMVFVKGSKEAAITSPSGITYAIPEKEINQLLLNQ